MLVVELKVNKEVILVDEISGAVTKVKAFHRPSSGALAFAFDAPRSVKILYGQNAESKARELQRGKD